MAQITLEKQVRAPIQRVFAVASNLRDAPKNIPAITKMDVLTEGPVRLGTRFRETRMMFGREATEEMEVTAFELNRTYTVTHRKAGTRIDATFTFEPLDGGTSVSIEFELAGHGLPPGLLSPLEWALSGKVRDVLSRDLADLKAAIEKVAH